MIKQEQPLKNKKAVNIANKMGKRYTLLDAMLMGKKLKIDWKKEKFGIGDLLVGMHYELEHGKVDPSTNVTDDNAIKTAKIAWAHLKERPDYYVQLMKIDPPKKMEKKASEMLEDMVFEKEAATVKEVKKGKKIMNDNNLGTFKDRWSGKIPEGFGRYGRATIYPAVMADDSFGYGMSVYGPAVYADTIYADTGFHDLVRADKKNNKDISEYDERMNPSIEEFLAAHKKTFAPIRKHKSKKALLSALTDKERDVLVKHRDLYGKKIIKDPYSHSDNIRTTTTHYYYV